MDLGRQNDEQLRRRVAVTCQPVNPPGIFIMVFGFPDLNFCLIVIPMKMGLAVAVIMIGVIGVQMAKRSLAERDHQTDSDREVKPLAHYSFSLLPPVRIE